MRDKNLRRYMKKFYQSDINEIYDSLDTSSDGLPTSVATKKLEEQGENVLKEKGKKKPITIFFNQFKNMMILLLILVGIVSLVYSIVNKESVVESIVIFGCVLINAFMGFFQEIKGENAIDALKTLTASTIKVKRDGKWCVVDTAKLVVGDIIALEAGDKVPADCRIISCVNAKVDESILTGESLAVDKDEVVIRKDVMLQDRFNTVYSGTSLTNGRIEAVVVATGMNTEIGAIASNLDRKEEKLTPLQVKVNKVSGFITIIACILIAITLCYGIIKDMTVMSIIMLCVSMVLASVPEVLPVSITATLTIGVQQMAKKKTIVKQMAAIETLGATQVICSDKTGTITTNQMTLVEIYANDKTYLDVKTQHSNLTMLNNILAFANDTESHSKNKGEFIGDPVDISLSKYLYNLGNDLDKLRIENERVGEIPFDSTRKMMSSVNKINGECVMLSKGSLSSILERSTKFLKNGKVIKITNAIKKKFINKERAMSRKSYKVLACAYKDVSCKKEYDEKDECDFVLVGLVGMMDPPKDGVKEAVQKCIEAKMKPIMITGDSLTTALAVAKDVGIADSNRQGIEGKVIDNLTDDELVSFVKRYTVYARVTPEHKVRIVRAFQQGGKVVAMTGDGVNDAPAIKLANVGVGMGKSGTDVTKNVADILLTDDSFSTIVTAVEEGRRIYNNVLRTILYNLSSNFAEIFLILMGMIISQSIISPLHILYIDLIADTLPSIALAFEKDSPDSMKKEPNGLSKPIFTPFMNASIIITALIEFVVTFGVFLVSKNLFGYEMAQTLALLCIVISEFTFTYNCKEIKGFSFKKKLFGNKFMNWIILGLILVQVVFFMTPIGSIFGLQVVSFLQFLAIVGVNILVFFVIELLKPLMARTFIDNPSK